MVPHAPYLRSDLAIRLAGLLLLAGAGLAFALLARLAGSRPSEGARAIEYLLAALGFLAASIGAAGLTSGRALLAQVALGPRWRRQPGME